MPFYQKIIVTILSIASSIAFYFKNPFTNGTNFNIIKNDVTKHSPVKFDLNKAIDQYNDQTLEKLTDDLSKKDNIINELQNNLNKSNKIIIENQNQINILLKNKF